MISSIDSIILGIFALILIEIIMLIKKTPIKRNLLILAFSIYIILLISIVFFPIPYKTKRYDIDYNFIPFSSTKRYLQSGKRYGRTAVLGNIALLIPWGLIWKTVFSKCKSYVFWLTTVVFCAGIEITQHLINLIIGFRYRCVDIDDFILNMLGAAIGYLLYFFIFRNIVKPYKKRL